MSLKLEFKDLEMKPFIILNKEYNPNRPSYVTSIAVSSSHFDKYCIHRTQRIYDFYNKDNDYEIVFVENAPNHEHFSELIKQLKRDKDSFERDYNRVSEALDDINEALCH